MSIINFITWPFRMIARFFAWLFRSAVRAVIGILLIIALIVGVVWLSVRGNDSNDNSSNDNSAAIAAWLRVDTIDPRADCLALVQASGRQVVQIEGSDISTYNWAIREIGSLAPLQAGNLAARQWSTSVGVPLARNAEGVVDAVNGRDQVLTRICLDPQFGSMVGNGFANLPGVADNNVDDNWDLRRWAGDPQQVINARAIEYMDLFGASNMSDREVVDKAVEYQQVIAPRLITLVLKLDVMGVEARTSVLNYHLVNGGLTAGLPVIGYNTVQEGLEAVLLGLTQKDRPECPLLIVGFNIYDGRWEQFGLPESCEPVGLVPPPTGPTPTTVPTEPTTPPTGPTTPPTPTTNPPSTSPPATQPPATTIPGCGDKIWNARTQRCEEVPALQGGTTIPTATAGGATGTTQTTMAGTVPVTAAPQTLPAGVVPVTYGDDPQVNPVVPEGATQVTTPSATDAPAAQQDASQDAEGETQAPD